jgi:predicted nucleic acid-binding protein
VIVLDASAAVELILWSDAGRRVAERIADPAESLHAPHLIDVEVTQVLRRAEHSRLLEPERAAEALRALGDLGLARYEHGPLLARAWELRRNCTAYDAVYLALAEALEAPLLTLDAGLATVPGMRAAVEVA